jgi:hypothetical protein
MRTAHIEGMISIIVPTEYTYHFPTTYTSVKQILLPVTRPLHFNTYIILYYNKYKDL